MSDEALEAALRVEKAFTVGGACLGSDPLTVARALLSRRSLDHEVVGQIEALLVRLARALKENT
jgi:hypothetical protein